MSNTPKSTSPSRKITPHPYVNLLDEDTKYSDASTPTPTPTTPRKQPNTFTSFRNKVRDLHSIPKGHRTQTAEAAYPFFDDIQKKTHFSNCKHPVNCGTTDEDFKTYKNFACLLSHYNQSNLHPQLAQLATNDDCTASESELLQSLAQAFETTLEHHEKPRNRKLKILAKHDLPEMQSICNRLKFYHYIHITRSRIIPSILACLAVAFLLDLLYIAVSGQGFVMSS